MDKRKLVGRFIELTDGWNKEVHNEIESRVDSEYDRLFPNNPDKDADIDLDQILVTKKKMREFYFERISFTANLLISVASFLVSVVAVVVAVGALIHSNSTPGAQPQGNTFMTSFMSIIAALLAAWFATIVAEDYRRYRDGQSLAAALLLGSERWWAGRVLRV